MSAPGQVASPDISQVDVSSLTPEQLEEHVIKQVEYYFSLENLAKDHYLVSLMDSGGYVPLRVVHGFKLVQQLTTDFDFFVSALRKSKNLLINEAAQTIKTGFKPQRLTLILRELPADATEAAVRAIFDSGDFPPVQSISFDAVGSLWYVSFQTEEAALKALDLVRTKTFAEKPIAARIKNETIRYATPLHAPRVPPTAPPVAAFPYPPTDELAGRPGFFSPQGVVMQGVPWTGPFYPAGVFEGAVEGRDRRRGSGGRQPQPPHPSHAPQPPAHVLAAAAGAPAVPSGGAAPHGAGHGPRHPHPPAAATGPASGGAPAAAAAAAAAAPSSAPGSGPAAGHHGGHGRHDGRPGGPRSERAGAGGEEKPRRRGAGRGRKEGGGGGSGSGSGASGAGEAGRSSGAPAGDFSLAAVAAAFPPLQGGKAAPTPRPAAGAYTKPFAKYNDHDMARIVEGLRDAGIKPPGLPDGPAVRAVPALPAQLLQALPDAPVTVDPPKSSGRRGSIGEAPAMPPAPPARTAAEVVAAAAAKSPSPKPASVAAAPPAAPAAPTAPGAAGTVGTASAAAGGGKRGGRKGPAPAATDGAAPPTAAAPPAAPAAGAAPGSAPTASAPAPTGAPGAATPAAAPKAPTWAQIAQAPAAVKEPPRSPKKTAAAFAPAPAAPAAPAAGADGTGSPAPSSQ